MRILQVNNYHYSRGGSDQYFMDITELLQQARHEVRTFSSENPENIHTEWLVTPGVRGVDTENAGSVKNIYRFLFSSEARRKMEQTLLDFRPDIIHLHIYYGQLTASILKPIRMSGIPVVQTLHEYKLVCPTHGLFSNGSFCDDCNGSKYWKAIQNKCNRGSFVRSALLMVEAYFSDWLGARSVINHFIAVSNFQRDHLIRLGIPQEKLSVLHHFAKNISSVPTRKGKYFMFVGRISEGKGLGVLLTAYSYLKGTSPTLKVVGSCADMSKWDNLAQSLGISEKVEWLGFQSGEELKALYEGCIATINPSLLNETFGLTCLESLAVGRSVIASDVGAFPEVVIDGVDGILFPPGDSLALANVLQSLIDDTVDVNQMGINAVTLVKKNFSSDAHLNGILEIYKSVSE